MRPSPAELRQRFQSFPDASQVDSVCKPQQGAITCRYLSTAANGDSTSYECQKYGPARGVIDKRVSEGDLEARGDNCGGIVEFIDTNRADLMGNPTEHVERMPNIEQDGEYDGIKKRRGFVSMAGIAIAEDMAQITVKHDGIELTARGFGAYVGSAKILFTRRP